MERQLLINKLSILRQIIEEPSSDLGWGRDVLDSIIKELQSELRQPDVIKSVCDHRNYRAGHSPFVPCICNDCGEEL